MLHNHWNTTLYEDQHGFVWQYGEDLLNLLSPQVGDRILDLGCGTGQLTDKIATHGAEIMGIDYSPAMIEKARQNYPHLQFDVADARNFQVEQPLDAIFSNAALHWVKEAEAVVNCIDKALKSGGKFVAEFGGKGNVKAIVQALEDALVELGYNSPGTINPWYFPSISEYATLLEKQNLEVTYATLFDRPTPLESGNTGMANWLQMFFTSQFLTGISPTQQAKIIQAVEERLQPVLYKDGRWWADYRRIRVVAIKHR
ncbi:MAG: methyltransferase domain-containing protein [Pelatocladus maniniholoensis HA4357-MV3]|jgi:trans-aconitate methyltransferase|uniref:Methyltransferase domain-containing protein n=1 Tax=Pelatocladus maniniholoensis HA4357-MV3 TaxID=1117104 RepID=A0A9E3H660_9NOST|nr:methyltransferase domain-containing protein [Pelatocladus maniniholoensis HA4357-MV3]